MAKTITDLAKAVHPVNSRTAERPVEVLKTSDEGEKLTSRSNKKQVGGFFDKAVHKQLMQLVVNRDTKIQNLLEEALNDLFEKYGMKRIA